MNAHMHTHAHTRSHTHTRTHTHAHTHTRIQVVDEVTERHDKYDFNAAGVATYNFFWDEFADWCVAARAGHGLAVVPWQA